MFALTWPRTASKHAAFNEERTKQTHMLKHTHEHTHMHAHSHVHTLTRTSNPTHLRHLLRDHRCSCLGITMLRALCFPSNWEPGYFVIILADAHAHAWSLITRACASRRRRRRGACPHCAACMSCTPTQLHPYLQNLHTAASLSPSVSDWPLLLFPLFPPLE